MKRLLVFLALILFSSVLWADGESSIDGKSDLQVRKNSIYFIERPSNPTTPTANAGKVFAKDAAGTTTLYFMDSTGTTTNLLSGSSSDIASVGDCASGACFDGTQGTTLTFNNAGGDKTLDYDGTDFLFNAPLDITGALDVSTTIEAGSGNITLTNSTGNIDGEVIADDTIDDDSIDFADIEDDLESLLDIGGEVTSTGMASTVIADSVTVTGWVMGTSTGTTPSANDNSTKLATTAYADNLLLQQNYKEAARVATTGNLVGTYLNGVFTYTATGTNDIDSVTLALNDRVLVKNQSDNTQNGIYKVTTAGALGVAGILTRSTDADAATDFLTGDMIFITAGTTQSSTTWAYTGIDSPTIGSTAITFVQVAGQGSFTGGTNITITGTSIAVNAASSFATSLTSPIFASNNADPADAGIIRLGNTEGISWEVDVAGADATLTLDSSEIIQLANCTLDGADIADGTVTANELGTDSVSADELNATGVESELESALDIGGEVSSTGMASTVIADSVTVTGWEMGASTATTPSADDNDTSLATTAYTQTEINAMGGRSLSASSGSMDADAELYTDTKCIYFESPVATDDFKSIWFAKQAATITSIWAESDQTVTFMLQVDDGSPADVDSVDLAPAAGTAEDTSLDGDATMAAGDRLDLAVTSVASTPTWCSICFTFTYND